ncbi:MGDG synthase family glycosyltransferase [Anaerosinus sp.]|uniref:MGDG synthase family glycosyltransferase n=1 Tax=Selenobaculum sp. TaxID=3074374 RepID=UPI0015AFEAC9
MKRIMILSASIGAGHVKAAQAIHESLNDLDDIYIVEYDVLTFIPEICKNFLLGLYLYSLKSFPQVYDQAYAWGNDNKWALYGKKLLNQVFSKKLLHYIRDYSPDCIIATHAIPAGFVSYLKEEKYIELMSATVITDFAVHRLCFNQNTDLFFIAHEGLVSNKVFDNFSMEKVYTTGIPVRQSFLEQVEKKKIYKDLNFVEDKPTILIMGGGAGLLPMEKILREFEMIDIPLQVIAVAGNNNILYNKLQCVKSSCHDIKTFKFVQSIHQFMSISDLMITKAGGVTIAEALCKGLPMLIYRPFPGQENYNAKFIETAEVGYIIKDINKISSFIKFLLANNAARLKELRENSQAIAKPNAAKHIIECIFQNFS